MAKLTVNGFDDLQADLNALLSMTDSMTDDILDAQAEVVTAAQKKSASKMWKGPYSTGETARSIKRGKIKKGDKGKSILIAPQGRNRKGERNAAVAFVNEYGKRGQPGRPAIRTANEQADKEVTAAAEKVIDGYMDKHNL